VRNERPTRVAVVGAGSMGATFAYTLLLSGPAMETFLLRHRRLPSGRTLAPDPEPPAATRFLASGVAAGFAFFAVGAAKVIVLNQPVLGAGIETLLTGGGAALLAYVVGSWLQAAFGVA